MPIEADADENHVRFRKDELAPLLLTEDHDGPDRGGFRSPLLHAKMRGMAGRFPQKEPPCR
jgi:hypothetical protein